MPIAHGEGSDSSPPHVCHWRPVKTRFLLKPTCDAFTEAGRRAGVRAVIDLHRQLARSAARRTQTAPPFYRDGTVDRALTERRPASLVEDRLMRLKLQTSLRETSASAPGPWVQATIASCVARTAWPARARDATRGAAGWTARPTTRLAAVIRSGAAHTTDRREVARCGEPIHVRVAA